MAEPKIVFCPNNHIYDSAIYEECPYCKKISEDQKALNKSIGNIDNDTTELLRPEPERASGGRRKIVEVMGNAPGDGGDDDHTELLRREEDDDHTELVRQEEDDDHTELIHQDSDEKRKGMGVKEKNYYVVGWMVCKNGVQRGRSFEVLNTMNYLYLDGEEVVLNDNPNSSAKMLATVSKSGDHFIVRSCNIRCGVNGISGYEEAILRNYDLLMIENLKFIFVELLMDFVDWGI